MVLERLWLLFSSHRVHMLLRVKIASTSRTHSSTIVGAIATLYVQKLFDLMASHASLIARLVILTLCAVDRGAFREVFRSEDHAFSVVHVFNF
jgi:uncharacterized membrane protein